MLLQPRKFKFKKKQKTRSFNNFKQTFLTYGDLGLRILSILKISGRQIFRLKIFLKKAIKKSDLTKRLLWFNVFPHLPLTRKAKGVRMGKGTGKLALWYGQFYGGTTLLEFKNLRYGRAKYFSHQLSYKFPVKVSFFSKQHLKLSICSLRQINRLKIDFY